MRNYKIISYTAFFLLLCNCSRVSIPSKDKDAAPLITITAIDRTHNTSSEHKVDRDMISVPGGTQMQFIVTAYNAGGVKDLTLKMSDKPTTLAAPTGQPDAAGKVPRQLSIALNGNQPITNIYTQQGQIFEVTATAVNFNAMLNSISLKIKVDNPIDPYTKSCGSFSLVSSSFKNDDKDYPQLRTELRFQFDPSKCNQVCLCQQVAMVQMIRFTDQTDENAGEHFQPFDEQEERMVKNNSNPAYNGWAIDRAEGMKWAHLGRFNDGTWDEIKLDPFTREVLGGFIQTGSNNKSTIYVDGINSDKSKYRVDVVTVPVCIDRTSACTGKILGYFGFSFARINNADTLTKPVEYTYNWMPEAFDLAVAEWNKQDGKEPLVLQRIR